MKKSRREEWNDDNINSFVKGCLMRHLDTLKQKVDASINLKAEKCHQLETSNDKVKV